MLNDNQTYGQGVAKAFADEAAKQGITVIGNTPWDDKQPNYTSFFQTIKAQNADCVYIGGIYDNNGGQLLKDKVTVLGDNNAVKLMAPDGFTGYPQLIAQPESQGMYLSFPGLSTDVLKAAGGAAAKLLADYKTKYGQDPASSYAIYGVAAVQVILDALSKSDGTRQGVLNAVFSGDGDHDPRRRLGHRQGDPHRPGHGRRERQGHLDRARQGQRRDVLQGMAGVLTPDCCEISPEVADTGRSVRETAFDRPVRHVKCQLR